MNQVTFMGGYGDPTRTIIQKYSDYGKVDNVINRLRNENTQLQETLNGLEEQRTALIKKFQNVVGLNKAEIQEKIQELAERIESIKYKIEENKSTITNAWYGYHERC